MYWIWCHCFAICNLSLVVKTVWHWCYLNLILFRRVWPWRCNQDSSRFAVIMGTCGQMRHHVWTITKVRNLCMQFVVHFKRCWPRRSSALPWASWLYFGFSRGKVNGSLEYTSRSDQAQPSRYSRKNKNDEQRRNNFYPQGCLHIPAACGCVVATHPRPERNETLRFGNFQCRRWFIFLLFTCRPYLRDHFLSA